MSKFAQTGDFCPNEHCADYGQRQSERQRNIIRFGKTKAGRQRFQCKTCRATFTETTGTLFYRRRTPDDEILETLALIAEGSRISSLARVKQHKEDTILDWLRDAADHVTAIEEVLLAEYHVERGQLDALWAYVWNKGEKRLPRNPDQRSVLACHDDRYG
jgi:transposase-like protein